MSARSMEEISKDYQGAVLQAGQLQYQIDTLSESLRELNKNLRSLNKEAFEAQAEEAKKKSAEQDAKRDSEPVAEVVPAQES